MVEGGKVLGLVHHDGCETRELAPEHRGHVDLVIEGNDPPKRLLDGVLQHKPRGADFIRGDLVEVILRKGLPCRFGIRKEALVGVGSRHNPGILRQDHQLADVGPGLLLLHNVGCFHPLGHQTSELPLVQRKLLPGGSAPSRVAQAVEGLNLEVLWKPLFQFLFDPHIEGQARGPVWAEAAGQAPRALWSSHSPRGRGS